MNSKTKDYCMDACPPWALDSFSYDGLCSHNPLKEAVAGKFDLSPEQLEAIVAEIKEKKRSYNQLSHASCYQTLKVEDRDHLRDTARKVHAKYYGSEKWAKKVQRFNDGRRASKMFYCATCDVTCTKQGELDRHKLTARHL